MLFRLCRCLLQMMILCCFCLVRFFGAQKRGGAIFEVWTVHTRLCFRLLPRHGEADTVKEEAKRKGTNRQRSSEREGSRFLFCQATPRKKRLFLAGSKPAFGRSRETNRKGTNSRRSSERGAILSFLPSNAQKRAKREKTGSSEEKGADKNNAKE